MATANSKQSEPFCNHIDLGQKLMTKSGKKLVKDLFESFTLNDWGVLYRRSGGRIVWKVGLHDENGKLDYDTYGKPIVFESPHLQDVLFRAMLFDSNLSEYDPRGDKKVSEYKPRTKGSPRERSKDKPMTVDQALKIVQEAGLMQDVITIDFSDD